MKPIITSLTSLLQPEIPLLPLLGLLLLVALLNCTYNRYGHGLSHIPGPFVASLTNWWRLFLVWGRRPELEHIRLHSKYGPVLRIGPKAISVSAAVAVPKIYALNSGFIKSDFYNVQQTLAKGRPLHTLFNTIDEKFHAKLRRAVSNAYSMSTLVQFEPYVDSTTKEFIHQIETKYADRPGCLCDLGTWLQYYAFDVIGELTYSQRLGFLRGGADVENIIHNIEWTLNYSAVVGQMPWLDKLLLKNPLRRLLSQFGFGNASTPMVTFAKNRLADRLHLDSGLPKAEIKVDPAAPRDFASRFLEAHMKDPDFIDNQQVLALMVTNVFAGSDTTAISLRAIFYYLLRNPSDMNRLLKEFREQKKNGNFAREDGLVNWKEVRDLPFLNAVVKEALRCHPAVGLTLERIAPLGGTTIAGQFIPGGTIVGCNPWTIHRDPSVYGPDAEHFRPSRWLEASAEQCRRMENSLLTFGAGARTCIGKNISLLEMYKVIPAILMKFEVQLADPNTQWKLHNAWFVKQSDLYVKFTTKKAA